MFKWISCIFVMAAAAATYANPSAIYGKWQTTQSINGFSFDLVIDFQPATIVMTNTCTYQGQSETVTVSAPEQVTDSQVSIKSGAQSSTNVGGFNCNVDIQPYTFNYLINGDKLTLTMGSQSLDLTRVH